MFDKILGKRLSSKSPVSSNKDGPQNASMGACPIDDSDSSYQQNPPLTLSQKLQRTRAQQQDRENQQKAELEKRNTDIITKFIVEHIEPLLETQVISGFSKMMYRFIPSNIGQTELTTIMPNKENIVEGFGGDDTTDSYVRKLKTKEYVKVIRLTRQEYSLEFWQQPTVIKELEKTLKLRLQANGEKLADTARNSAGRSWYGRRFFEGETLLPGHTGIQLLLYVSKLNPTVTFIELYAEIT